MEMPLVAMPSMPPNLDAIDQSGERRFWAPCQLRRDTIQDQLENPYGAKSWQT